MHGNNKFICIAGKNRCAIDFLKYTSSKIQKKWILVLPNKMTMENLAGNSLRICFKKNF